MTDEEKIKAIRERILRWTEASSPHSIDGVVYSYRHLIEDIAYIVGPE